MSNDIGVELLSKSPERDKLNRLWQEVDINWLKNYYSQQLSARTLHNAREHPFTAAARASVKDAERPVKPGHFLIASEAPEKLRLISEVIQEQGGVAQPVVLNDEKAAKQLSYSVAKRWGRFTYPLIVSAEKAGSISSKSIETGQAVLSMDTVVIAPNGQVLEKPQDERILKEFLQLVKGKTLRVLVGVNALIPLRSGRVLLRLDEGAQITIKIRDLTDEEISEYIRENKEHALIVSGGIDFSSGSGQRLIDKTQAVEIRPLDGTIYDRYAKSHGVSRKPVSLDPENVDLLTDYFRGAPREIIALLMHQAKEIQEKIKHL